jgi:hypothetical protein
MVLLAACTTILISRIHADEVSTESIGTAMTEAAKKFLDSLDKHALAKASMDFNDPARLDWHNIPKPSRRHEPGTAKKMFRAHPIVLERCWL